MLLRLPIPSLELGALMRAILILLFALSLASPPYADTGMSVDPDATYYRRLWAGHQYCYPTCILPPAPSSSRAAFFRGLRDKHPVNWARLMEELKTENPERYAKLRLLVSPDP
jgi:hypothetical protein